MDPYRYLAAGVDLSGVLPLTGGTGPTEGGARAFIDELPIGLMTLDCKGAITWVNPTAAKILGKSPMDLLGQNGLTQIVYY